MLNTNFPDREGPARSGPPGALGALFTVAEVAAGMRVSTMTVYRLIKAGDLRAVRVGKSYRLTEEDVDQYLADGFTAAGRASM